MGYFFDYLKIEGATLEERACSWLSIYKEKDHKWAYDCLIDYVTYLRKRADDGEITGGTIGNYYAVVKAFYDSLDVQLNWRKIEKGLPESGTASNDRAPRLEEIRRIVEYGDKRIKVIVYLMLSAGIRIGALENLRLSHFTPVYSPQNPNQLIAGKLSIYEGRSKPYITFCSPEACQAIEEYVQFRKLHGEQISPESWLLRDKFETTGDNAKNNSGVKTGLATVPKRLQTSGIKKILIRAMRSQGIRNQPLAKGQKRFDFALAHGYRKYFKTNAERVMRPINVEILMNHRVGISNAYYRPNEQDLLEDYLRAVDYLTVNKDQKIASQLQKQVAELTEKGEEETEEMKRQFLELKDSHNRLVQYVKDNESVIFKHNFEKSLTELLSPRAFFDNPNISKESKREYARRLLKEQQRQRQRRRKKK